MTTRRRGYNIHSQILRLLGAGRSGIAARPHSVCMGISCGNNTIRRACADHPRRCSCFTACLPFCLGPLLFLRSFVPELRQLLSRNPSVHSTMPPLPSFLLGVKSTEAHSARLRPRTLTTGPVAPYPCHASLRVDDFGRVQLPLGQRRSAPCRAPLV